MDAVGANISRKPLKLVVLCHHQEVSQRERDKDRDREVETVTERGGKRDREIEIACVSLEDVYERYCIVH